MIHGPLVRSAGIEPATSGTANRRSIQLSYERALEPAYFTLFVPVKQRLETQETKEFINRVIAGLGLWKHLRHKIFNVFIEIWWYR